VGTVIPHELTHLVIDTAAGNPYHLLPRWLNEGLAVYESQGYDGSDRGLVSDAVSGVTLIPLDGLIGQFPTGDGFFLAYAESVSAVDFMFRTYGTDAVVSLVKSYKDGHTDDEAFQRGLGVDANAFAAAWLASLGATAPARYGPQPAPPGPIPSAWLAGGGTGVPSTTTTAGGPAVATAQATVPAPAAPSATDATPVVVVVVVIAAGLGLLGLYVARRGRRREAGGPEA
jgi:hypothetical protein